MKRFIKDLVSSGERKIFCLVVKCADCGEEIKVRINQSSDIQLEYNSRHSEHRYTIKKEIIGKQCFNLMNVTLALRRDFKVLFSETQACQFMDFRRE